MAQDKPLVEYPCLWAYTVIGEEQAGLADAIRSLLADEAFDLAESNRSKNGRFQSYRVAVRVDDEAQRDRLFAALHALPGVRFVL